jgi:hypothetical protein|tara:strand:- start:1127 stop:1501 length:375 start_codon:yes stop_codon:yes gene_type:complete
VIAMVDSKTPDNVIPFPKKYRRPTTPEQDKVMADRIKKEHQKIYCQAMCDEITENILIKLHSENIKVTEKNFLKDYKLVAEALKSMMLRTQGIKHPLQKKTDKAVVTKGSGQDLYAITIDYDKF